MVKLYLADEKKKAVVTINNRKSHIISILAGDKITSKSIIAKLS